MKLRIAKIPKPIAYIPDFIDPIALAEEVENIAKIDTNILRFRDECDRRDKAELTRLAAAQKALDTCLAELESVRQEIAQMRVKLRDKLMQVRIAKKDMRFRARHHYYINQWIARQKNVIFRRLLNEKIKAHQVMFRARWYHQNAPPTLDQIKAKYNNHESIADTGQPVGHLEGPGANADRLQDHNNKVHQ